MIELFSDPAVWMGLGTLIVLEVVLGIDNIIFISVITSRLPEKQQPRARKIGIGLALISRLALLAAIAWIVKLTEPLFSIMSHEVSWRDIILLTGGLFLLFKATEEIHKTLEPDPGHEKNIKAATYWGVLSQIVFLDVIFSVDSVITAIGMVEHIEVMVIAVCVSVAVMLLAAESISSFIQKHPTTKMLAFSMLMLIGMALIADGLHFHIPRGYLYFAIAFSMLVEVLNLMASKRRRRRAQAKS